MPGVEAARGAARRHLRVQLGGGWLGGQAAASSSVAAGRAGGRPGLDPVRIWFWIRFWTKIFIYMTDPAEH